MIVDAQVHVVAPGRGRYAFPHPGGTGVDIAARGADRHRFPDARQLREQMDAAGVDRAILVPPEQPDGSFANEASFAAADQHPERFRVMARLAPGTDRWAANLADWTGRGGFAGIRMSFRDDSRHAALLTGPAAEELWVRLERDGLPLMLHAPGQASAVATIAGRHPGLRIAYDHAGLDGALLLDDLQTAVRPCLGLAGLANVSVKASALPAVVREGYPYPGVARVIAQLVAAFGGERVFWGSDLSRSPAPYPALLRFLEEDGALDASTRALVMGDALNAWLGWR